MPSQYLADVRNAVGDTALRSILESQLLGVSRQVAIPKKVHDQLGLSLGDYLEVEVEGNRIILTAKQLVDKRLARRWRTSASDGCTVPTAPPARP